MQGFIWAGAVASAPADLGLMSCSRATHPGWFGAQQMQAAITSTFPSHPYREGHNAVWVGTEDVGPVRRQVHRLVQAGGEVSGQPAPQRQAAAGPGQGRAAMGGKM